MSEHYCTQVEGVVPGPPCDGEEREVCGGLDPAYPGQACQFPRHHDGPCIDLASVDG